MTEAEKHILKAEPRFKSLIDRFGPCELIHPLRGANVYESLMSSILYQQLSTKAASTIKGRLYDLFPTHSAPPPSGILALTLEELRAVGVSRQKAGYLQDLASKADTIPTIEELDSMSDEDIIQRLIPIKGIGRWSVEMLLMFTFGRMDVLPVDDMGVQEGMKRILNLEARPKKKEMEALAEPWRPYRSVASWYLWRALEN
ncbi:MAG: Fe-S cluster assembly protein HesB [Armatimonadetes bacterium Cent15-Ar3]|nr:MAG: Fe-S cluster assembly protein HesB [Armatimonadetes bacterium Cent15-Ar3]